MIANRNLLRMKYVRVIEALAEHESISLNAALDRFYKSSTYAMMRDGVSDLHCMSIPYLVEEILAEASFVPAN